MPEEPAGLHQADEFHPDNPRCPKLHLRLLVLLLVHLLALGLS